MTIYQKNTSCYFTYIYIYRTTVFFFKSYLFPTQHLKKVLKREKNYQFVISICGRHGHCRVTTSIEEDKEKKMNSLLAQPVRAELFFKFQNKKII